MAAGQITNWQEEVVYGAEGPQPQALLESSKAKVVLVGLEPGQRIPPHPAPASVYFIIAGTGWVTLNDERLAVGPGDIVSMPQGTVRGFEAETRLTFLGSREQ